MGGWGVGGGVDREEGGLWGKLGRRVGKGEEGDLIWNLEGARVRGERPHRI